MKALACDTANLDLLDTYQAPLIKLMRCTNEIFLYIAMYVLLISSPIQTFHIMKTLCYSFMFIRKVVAQS